MRGRAEGAFEVAMKPQPLAQADESGLLGRMSLAKTFTGGLEASSHGEMLSARTATAGSAGYVAIERVDGVLDGRRGTFVLQHMGVMDRGDAHATINVVPDSGTGELVGLSGTMTIVVADGDHTYTFDYTLPED